MEQLCSQRTDFQEIWYWRIFRKHAVKIQISLKSNKNKGYLQADLCKFTIVSGWVLLMMKNVSEKIVEKIRTHILYSTNSLHPPPPHQKKILAVYEIMWKHVAEPYRPRLAIWCMRIACWVTKATVTHSEYVICIAFPLQRWLCERTSVLRFIHILSVLLFSCY